MTIKAGERLPQAQFTVLTPDGMKRYSTSDVFDGRKVVAFAVPGAFTPTCHLKHLPGFLKHADAIKAKGVDEVVCISVNDAFVLDAWGKSTEADGKIKFLADGNGDFTRQIGLELDGSGFGLGARSQRYAMIVENGIVSTLYIEPKSGEAEESSAERILAAL